MICPAEEKLPQSANPRENSTLTAGQSNGQQARIEIESRAPQCVGRGGTIVLANKCPVPPSR